MSKMRIQLALENLLMVRDALYAYESTPTMVEGLNLLRTVKSGYLADKISWIIKDFEIMRDAT